MDTAYTMSAAGAAVFLIGLIAARRDIARGRGIDKVVALANLCYAVPLAVFGTEHFAAGQAMLNMVPRYMPLRLAWVYLVGIALIAASVSIAAKVQVQWSGLLLGTMMFLFVAMLHFPGAVAAGGRLPWTIVFRETSFGAAGWVLAGDAMRRERDGDGKILIIMGRVLIGIVAIFFGVQHFLHPLALPGVPLQKQMPTWVPVRPLIDYLTGALLIVSGVCFLLGRKTREAASYLGAWIVLAVVVIYGPVMIAALANPSSAVRVEGVSYFADTLLFGGVILSLARATMPVDRRPRH